MVGFDRGTDKQTEGGANQHIRRPQSHGFQRPRPRDAQGLPEYRPFGEHAWLGHKEIFMTRAIGMRRATYSALAVTLESKRG
jgi:hypothetical protein